MPGIAGTDHIDPQRLSAGERQQFTESLYKVHAAVFDGVTLPEFAKYVVDSKADITRILRFKGDAGEVVGYFALHVFESLLSGRITAVFRAEAGMLRKYRGGSATMGFAIREFLAYKARHPRRPTYYLGCLVHPSSYSLFARWSENRLWPNPEAAPPPEVTRFIDELGDLFELARVDGETPLVRAVGWKTRDSEVERQYWRNCPKPSAQFFVQQNPHYTEGCGLLTLVPLRLAPMLSVAARYAVDKSRPRLAALGARLFGARSEAALSRAQVLAVLRAAPLLRPLPDADLELLARQLQTRRFAAGEPVIRKGEPGDAMYLVFAGSAYIVVDSDGEEKLLDSMDPGDGFGEMALLTGEPRSTTVRAAGALTVLRLAREPFNEWLASRPDLRAMIWDAYVQRALRSHLCGLARFERLSLATRNAFITGQQRIEVRAGEEIELSHQGLVFLAAGAAEVAQGPQWFTLTAPALLTSTGTVRLSSAKGAVAARLPALEAVVGTTAS